MTNAEALATGMVIGALLRADGAEREQRLFRSVFPCLDEDGVNYTNRVQLVLQDGTTVYLTVEEQRAF